MGSLFLVLIPVRSFEFRLRLKEHNIFQTGVVPVQAPDEQEQGSQGVVDALNRTAAPHEGQEGVMPGRDIILPITKDKTLAYKVKTDVGTMLLQITRDTMKLTKADTHTHSLNETHSKTSVHSDDGVGGRLRRLSIRSSPSDEEVKLTEMINSSFLEKHMEDALTKFDLLYASWEHSIDEKFSQICFTVPAEMEDEIINHLHTVGIGKKYESTLGVCGTTVFTREREGKEIEMLNDAKGKWDDFIASIRARLTVAQVVQNVKANAVITFDFMIMVIVAGIIAALGLLEDSPVNLIASMLVSPLMGPIMAFTFGAMIRDMPLVKVGIVSELVGLFTCWAVGFTFGIFLQAAPCEGPWAHVKEWPTNEMISRAKYRSLIVGAGVAIPSGAGVALSILAGNAGSLVGVAISASLLPPCVNCGIFFGLSTVIGFQESGKGNTVNGLGCEDTLVSGNPIESRQWITPDNSTYQPIYCRNIVREYLVMGTISLCLTLLNIILIFLVGIICLKIKEVAPYTTKTAMARFWKHDLREARAYNIKHGASDDVPDVDNPRVLREVDDDFVFNRVRNKAIWQDENVIHQVKEKQSKGQVPKQSRSGWFGGLI